jgi:hypothetical protein
MTGNGKMTNGLIQIKDLYILLWNSLSLGVFLAEESCVETTLILS